MAGVPAQARPLDSAAVADPLVAIDVQDEYFPGGALTLLDAVAAELAAGPAEA
jgi:hypothetical protein